MQVRLEEFDDPLGVARVEAGDECRIRLVGRLLVGKPGTRDRLPPCAAGTAAHITQIKAIVLNCTLKPSPASSSAELLGSQVLEALKEHQVTGELVRIVDHDIRFGVSTDEGDGDEWPQLRERILAAQILVVVTPIWMGQPSAVCKLVLERLNAEISETDDQGRLSTYGKVAGIGVVGNEDGAHHVTAELAQALTDVGFTLPANAVTYWVGEAMQTIDYQDLPSTPEKTDLTTRTLATNLDHLARLLDDAAYPATA
ncbi:flavodoxin family protein [Nocardioides limicola]|uniref:flavodoxin family protein n=1 Tax=Nocardioides limicola TaxID=2803368 RepID=UPI00193B62EA|nr:NAD(P)H-dependent oxidoreductase [Nocardioides sp. DJM-14]